MFAWKVWKFMCMINQSLGYKAFLFFRGRRVAIGHWNVSVFDPISQTRLSVICNGFAKTAEPKPALWKWSFVLLGCDPGYFDFSILADSLQVWFRWYCVSHPLSCFTVIVRSTSIFSEGVFCFFGPGSIFKQCPVQPDTDFSNLHVQVISLLNCCIAELIETTESIPAGCLSLGGPSEGWIFFFRIERGYQHKIPPLKKFPSPPLCTP